MANSFLKFSKGLGRVGFSLLKHSYATSLRPLHPPTHHNVNVCCDLPAVRKLSTTRPVYGHSSEEWREQQQTPTQHSETIKDHLHEEGNQRNSTFQEWESRMKDILTLRLLSNLHELTPSDIQEIHQELDAEGKACWTGCGHWSHILMYMLPEHGSAEECLHLGRLLFEFSMSQEGIPRLGSYVFYLQLLSKSQGPEHDPEIWKLYSHMREEYEVLDIGSTKVLIGILSKTSHWQECIKLKDDLKHFYALPTTVAYTHIITAALREGQTDVAISQLHDCASFVSNPQEHLYEALFSPNSPSSVAFEALGLIGKNGSWIPSKTSMEYIKAWFDRQESPKWMTNFTWVSGCSCNHCGKNLDKGELSAEDYTMLKDAVLQKVLLQGDMYRHSNPEELKEFTAFLDDVGKFDIVIDGLNVIMHDTHQDGPRKGMSLFPALVQELQYTKAGKERRVLIIGRGSMYDLLDTPEGKWLESKTTVWKAQRRSSDDTFLIYAALHSGPDAKIVTNDELRNYRAILGKKCGPVMAHWQSLRQITFHMNKWKTRTYFPNQHAVRAQLKEGSWHVPFQDHKLAPSYSTSNSWLCARPTHSRKLHKHSN